MKAKLIPNLKWSKWVKDEISGDFFSYLGPWDGCHAGHHKVVIVKFHENGQTLYYVSVEAGPYGETTYCREERLVMASYARELAERAALAALANGHLTH